MCRNIVHVYISIFSMNVESTECVKFYEFKGVHDVKQTTTQFLNTFGMKKSESESIIHLILFSMHLTLFRKKKEKSM